MAIPQPGTRVRGSESGSPINALFDLLGRRWALGVIWNLDPGPSTFRDLQQKCGGVSPTVLNQRIKDLKEAGILTRTVEGYALTERGKTLREAVVPLAEWSALWSEELFGYRRPGWEAHKPT